MTTYQCQTCGETHTMSADSWAWHRLVDHPRMGLPVHDPGRMGRVETPAQTRERHHLQQRGWYASQPSHTTEGIATND